MMEIQAPVRLPPMPTREEIVQYCNAGFEDRPDPITIRTVRGWQERGLIKPLNGFRKPVRFDGRRVIELITGSRRAI